MVKVKKWYMSKGKVGAVLVALGFLGSFLQGTIDLTQALTGVFAALSVFGIRDALK